MADRGDAVVGLRSTVAFKSASEGGGGIHQEEGADEGVIGLGSSIVARNSAPTGPDVLESDPDSDIFLVAASFSIVGDSSGSGITGGESNQMGDASAPIDPCSARWPTMVSRPRPMRSSREARRSMPLRPRPARRPTSAVCSGRRGRRATWGASSASDAVSAGNAKRPG